MYTYSDLAKYLFRVPSVGCCLLVTILDYQLCLNEFEKKTETEATPFIAFLHV